MYDIGSTELVRTLRMGDWKSRGHSESNCGHWLDKLAYVIDD